MHEVSKQTFDSSSCSFFLFVGMLLVAFFLYFEIRIVLPFLIMQVHVAAQEVSLLSFHCSSTCGRFKFLSEVLSIAQAKELLIIPNLIGSGVKLLLRFPFLLSDQFFGIDNNLSLTAKIIRQHIDRHALKSLFAVITFIKILDEIGVRSGKVGLRLLIVPSRPIVVQLIPRLEIHT